MLDEKAAYGGRLHLRDDSLGASRLDHDGWMTMFPPPMSAPSPLASRPLS
jgi:hypothetical protein